MKQIYRMLAGLILVLAVTLSAFAQATGSAQPVVSAKYAGYSYPMTATSGNYIWTIPPATTLLVSTTNGYAGNYTDAIIYWVTTGSPTCSMAVTTGPTAATATLPVNDPNATINCGSSGQKLVSGLNNYFNIMPTFNSGTLTVYVTLLDGLSHAHLGAIAATALQGNGASLNNSPWFIEMGDGTHNMPAGDVPARAINVIPGNGSSNLFDTRAHAGFVIPTNGTSNLFDTLAHSGFVIPSNGSANLFDTAAHKGFAQITDGTTNVPIASGAVLAAANANGALPVVARPTWSVTNAPGVGNQASVVVSAGATGVRHVADCIIFSGGATSSASLTQMTVQLLDGSTVLHSWLVFPSGTGENIKPVGICGLNLVGSSATSMTLQFSQALTNEFESVSLTGYDVQ